MLRSFVLACLSLAATLAQAQPRAWLDRDTIRLGETVTLNVETDARGGSQPDFSVLDRDFRRLGTSSNTQISYVDGKQSARTIWAVALEPLAEGSFGIPALAVNGASTQPLRLTVLATPQGASGRAGDDAFLEVEADPVSPYVQQQVRYTIRLYFGVQLLEGQLDEPQVAGARVSKMGQDVQYSTTLDGRRYTVVERRYAVVPEASGTLTLPGPQFRGRALKTGGYGSLFNANAMLATRGDATTLEVRPRPPAAPTPWLPAQSLLLQDESKAPVAPLQVGEPLEITLRLRAQGLSAEQLPELVLPQIDGAQVYPDQESSQTRDDGQWLQSERVRKFAIVPSRAGTLELPALQFGWWDVGKDAAATAGLPARRVEVVAAPGTVVESPAASPDPIAEPGSPPATSGPGIALQPWAWIATAFAFALLWLATLVALWRRRSPAPAGVPAAPPRRPVIDWSQLLARDDLAAIGQALTRAVHARDPAARNLADVARHLDDAGQRALLLRLERALYAGEADPALAGELRKAFARGPHWRSAPIAGARDEALPPLYPQRE